MSVEQNSSQALQESLKNIITPELSSPVDILKKSFEIYKANFKKLIGINFLPILGFVPLGLVVVIFVGLRTLLENQSSVLMTPNLISGLLGIVTGMFGVVFAITSYASFYIFIKDISKNLSIKQALLEGWKIAANFFITGILVSVCTILWGLLFVLPGVWAAINYTFALWISVENPSELKLSIENPSGSKRSALKKSKALVKGYWWEIFGRVIFMWLVSFLIAFLLKSIVSLVTNDNNIAVNMISWIANFLIAPLTLVYTYQLYLDLKRVHPVE